MNLQRVTCSACGANLDVPDDVQLVNCRHCGASLNIVQNGSVTYTEAMEAIQETANQIQRNTEILRLHGRLSQLDRDWDAMSKSLMIRGKYGQRHVPTKLNAALLLIVMGGFGLYMAKMTLTIGAPNQATGFCIFYIGVCVAMSIWTFVSAQRYATAQREYEEQRDLLLEQLRERGM